VSQLPGAVCIDQLDTLGRVRIYFPYDASLGNQEWKYRAYDADGNIVNNAGRIGYSLYYASLVNTQPIIPPGEMPPETECSAFTQDESGQVIVLQGDESAGQAISVKPNNFYAIQTTSGPWSNNGTNSYEVGLSDDNGATYSLLYRYAGILCSQSTDSDHVIVFFQAIQGKSYKLRVFDEAGNFDDNTGTIGVTLYGATNTIQAWDACSDTYIPHLIPLTDDQRKVPAQNENGVIVAAVEAGNTYGLEVTDEHTWNQVDLVPQFTAQVSDDSGATWQNMGAADFAICAVNITPSATGNQKRYRIYFTATANGIYRIRVLGLSYLGNWSPANFGYIMYKLYKVDLSDLPGADNGNGAYIPPNWKTACYETCNRPSAMGTTQLTILGGTINLPDIGGYLAAWIDYSRCAIQQYLTWCPEHTEALVGVFNQFSDREPFGTVLEIVDGMKGAQKSIVALESLGGESGQAYTPRSVLWQAGGGENGTDNGFSILPHVDTDSIWGGGQLDLNANYEAAVVAGGENATSVSEYLTFCNSTMGSVFGVLTTGVCDGINLARSKPWIWVSLQLLLDVSVMVMFYDYIMKNWINTGAFT
jgi:hypothetical protein